MTLTFQPSVLQNGLVPIFAHNMLVWTSMVTRKHFWRQIFGICEKYEVNYTANWSQNNTKMTVVGH